MVPSLFDSDNEPFHFLENGTNAALVALDITSAPFRFCVLGVSQEMVQVRVNQIRESLPKGQISRLDSLIVTNVDAFREAVWQRIGSFNGGRWVFVIEPQVVLDAYPLALRSVRVQGPHEHVILAVNVDNRQCQVAYCGPLQADATAFMANYL